MIEVRIAGNYEGVEKIIQQQGGYVDLWNYTIWPKKKSELKDIVFECRLLEAQTAACGYLIFWVPLSAMHATSFHPSHISEKGSFEHEGMSVKLRDIWSRVGSIITANEIGYIYRKPHVSEDHVPNVGCNKFFSEHKHSSIVTKYIIDRMCKKNALIIDQRCDRRAHLATWAKRLGVNYIGYAKDEDDYEEIHKKLAQIELPMIQESLFDDLQTNRS